MDENPKRQRRSFTRFEWVKVFILDLVEQRRHEQMLCSYRAKSDTVPYSNTFRMHQTPLSCRIANPVMGAAVVELLAFDTKTPNVEADALDEIVRSLHIERAEPAHPLIIKFPDCSSPPMLPEEDSLTRWNPPTPADQFAARSWHGDNVFWVQVASILKRVISHRTRLNPERITLYHVQLKSTPFRPLRPFLQELPTTMKEAAKKTLRDFGLPMNSEIFVGYDNVPDLVTNTFFVMVRNSGKIIPVMGLLSQQSSGCATVKRLKEFIHASEGVPVYQQSLFLGFRPLHDEDPLDKYDIHPQTVVELRRWGA